MTTPRLYPQHIYEPVRAEIAISYLKHEFRKLLPGVQDKGWEIIDKNISGWMHSLELATPRDFWNGFHGICMGFKLKTGLTQALTAENIKWQRKIMFLNKLWFGTVLERPLKKVKDEKISVKELRNYYFAKKRNTERGLELKYLYSLTAGKTPRDNFPIIVIQTINGDDLVYSVKDGNRRLAKAVLEGKDKILAYVGDYTSGERTPKNYWIPTSLLMDILYFAKNAYDADNKSLFREYISILRDMLEKSDSAKFELTKRALSPKPYPFRDAVLNALNFPTV